MNPIADLLTRAKARTLAHPCKGWPTRDKDGNECDPGSPDAAAWDVYGAIYHEPASEEDKMSACTFLDRAAEKLPFDGVKSLTVINDERPDLIPQMFDLAIEEANK